MCICSAYKTFIKLFEHSVDVTGEFTLYVKTACGSQFSKVDKFVLQTHGTYICSPNRTLVVLLNAVFGHAELTWMLKDGSFISYTCLEAWNCLSLRLVFYKYLKFLVNICVSCKNTSRIYKTHGVTTNFSFLSLVDRHLPLLTLLHRLIYNEILRRHCTNNLYLTTQLLKGHDPWD